MKPSLDRRAFIRTATVALTATAAGWTGRSAESAGAKRSLRKGIMYGTIGVKGSVREKFKVVREAGFEGVEANSHMDQEEVLKARDEAQLEIPSVCCSTHWAKPLSDPNPSVRAQGLEGLRQALRDAHRYGAKSVLFVPGVVNKQISYAETYDRSQAGIREVIPLAAELRIRIAIENVWNNFLLSPMEAARHVDEFNSPWVGWHFDIGNIINYGFPEQWIRTLNRRIVMIHLKEFSRKKRDDLGLWKGFEVPFLEGDNDWPSVMKAIDEIGYKTWGIAEQGGGGNLEGLKDLSARIDKIFAS